MKGKCGSPKKSSSKQSMRPDVTRNLSQPIALKSGGETKSRVNESGNYTKPAMRKRLFESIKAGGKGGKPGQWSARKAQMLAKSYKEKGGGYKS